MKYPVLVLLLLMLMLLLIVNPATAFAARPTTTIAMGGGSQIIYVPELKGDPGTNGLNNMTPGEQGIQGIPGAMNMTMNQTANMSAGATGEQGIQGVNGTPGNNGADGNAATISINATFTGLSGTDALVTNIGSVYATLLDFKIPTGIQGIQGIPGTMNLTANMTAGEKGDKGEQGEPGVANMTAGQQGTPGLDNMTANMTQGAQGIPGIMNLTANMTQGPQGIQGLMNQTANMTANMTAGSPGVDSTTSSTTLIHSDFYDPGVTTALPGLTGLAISTGTVAVVATTADHPGVIYMRDSTTAAGGYKYGCAGTQLIGGGETFEVVFQPVGVRANQYAQMGWSDTAAAGTNPVDGVWFNISATGAVISLRGNTSSNSVRSGTATGYIPTTATWYRGTIAVNTAGTLVTYTIYNAAGASQWTDTVATNIPTGAGRDTSPCLIVAEGTTDAAANILVLDFVRWGSTRTLVR